MTTSPEDAGVVQQPAVCGVLHLNGSSPAVEWDATPAYGFPTRGDHVVQRGLVTALLDAAMGGATWTVLDHHQAFLTADLRVEFLRANRLGLLSRG